MSGMCPLEEQLPVAAIVKDSSAHELDPRLLANGHRVTSLTLVLTDVVSKTTRAYVLH